MKIVILTICVLLAAAIVPAQAPSFFCVTTIDGKIQPHPADSLTYKVHFSNYQWVPIAMPVAGKCRIAFESYDDREDANVTAQDIGGKLIGTNIKPKGDIEILVVDEIGFDNFVRGKQYYALWSSGRAYNGDKDVPLPAGRYYVVLNNRHGSFASKSVTLTLGRGEAPPETPMNLAPAFAPLRTETRTNQTNSNTNDAPPKLQKRPKTKP